jgi:hypothetical protein
MVLTTDCSRVFVHTFCLTAQVLDGGPIYLLYESLYVHFELFQDRSGFS